MPRTSMLESLLTPAASSRSPARPGGGLPAPAPGTALAAGASHLVEAATTEQALADVHDLLGPNARIVDARRVRRGGVSGFFAKEVVQLHVASADPSPPSARRIPVEPAVGDVSGAAPTAPTAGGSPVDRLLADVDDVPDDVDFATYLRDQLSTGGASPSLPADRSAAGPLQGEATPPAVEAVATPLAPWSPPRVQPPATSPVAPPVPSENGWSRDALLRLGLPVELVAAVERAAPTDDLGWTVALTEALRPSCRPLPAGPSVLVGPRGHELGKVDGDEVEVARSRTWLSALRPGRWVHVVAGGDGWRTCLEAEPMAVSWARNEDLPDALRCAVELGLVLGYGPGSDGARRARPFDVALAVRDLVDGS